MNTLINDPNESVNVNILPIVLASHRTSVLNMPLYRSRMVHHLHGWHRKMGTTGVTVLPADQFVSSQCMAQINYLGRFSFNEMSYGYIALKKMWRTTLIFCK